MSTTWTPNSWRSKPIRQVPAYPDPARLAAVEEKLRRYPPLVFAGEVRRLKAALARAVRGPRLRAAGRRLRRKLPGFHRQHHPRHVPRAAADGGGADLRRLAAGGEARPHGRPVRQAALVGHRHPRRRDPAHLSRRHRQRRGVHARGPRARPRAHGNRLFPVRRHAQPAARLRHRRLCRPARGASLEPRLRRPLAAGRALPDPGPPHRRDAGLHVGLRHFVGHHAADPRDRFLHQPRGAAAALRAGADPRSIPPPATGTPARRISSGSATAPASPTARMSSSCAA